MTEQRKPRFLTGGDEPPAGPKRMRYPCFAQGCPMPGSIFPGGSDSGVCSWHFGCNGDEIRRVTQALSDWECVSRAIRAGRTFTNDPTRATNHRAADAAKAAVWADLAPSLVGSGWKLRVEPKDGEHLGDWTRRLEQFLRNRTKEAVTGKVITNDYAPTPTVADMLTRVKGRLAAPDNWGAP